MINQSFFKKLKESHASHEKERKGIIEKSNLILHASKRVIFSIHRDNLDTAAESLKEIEKNILKLEKKYSFNRLTKEGAYKAGIEEYVEARGLYEIVTGKGLKKFPKLKIGFDSYLAGFCDIAGELVRLATNKASAGEIEEVIRIKGILNDLMTELVEFDMTGYLRTKYDQSRGALRRMEQISYEIKTREISSK